MITVRDILNAKGSNVWSVSPDTPICDALKLMAEKEVGAVLVLKDNKVVGIFSERDLVRKIITLKDFSCDVPIRKVMSDRVLCVQPSDSVNACMQIMTEKRFRHLPVLEGETLLGMISIGDLVKSVIAEQNNTIESLGKYISGTY